MKILLMSDTHGRHGFLKNLPDADMVIHSGDCTSGGGEWEAEDFMQWFSMLKYEHKVFIAGNHDFFFDVDRYWARSLVPDGVTYLENESVEIMGYKIWGSPFTPRFGKWAFMHNRGEKMTRMYSGMPDDTDIVITHGPAYGILDSLEGRYLGCVDLAKRLSVVRPKLHAFGHIHEGYGMVQKNGTTHVNASILDGKNYVTNRPILIEI